jgi:aminomethyltransferase
MKKHTPYFHRFQALGAKFKERCGFATADIFTSNEREHRAAREAVGLFDVFNQVCVEVKGRDAETLLDGLMAGDVRRMVDGGVLYGLMCNDEGGIFEELLCFKFDAQRYWLTPTPSRVDEVAAYVDAHGKDLSVNVTNLGYANAYLSVQGPRSRELLAGLTDVDLANERLPFNRFAVGALAGVPKAVISRSGYSGELGFELFFPVEYAEHVWDTIVAASSPMGGLPCGMKAMRSLRIEKRFLLYGLDISEKTDPYSAGLAWAVRLRDREFKGRAALQRLADQGTERQLCLLDTGGTHGIATGDVVLARGTPVGVVTSADHGYTVGSTLAFSYLPRDMAVDGVQVDLSPKAEEGRTVSARVLLRAPYDPEGRRTRS